MSNQFQSLAGSTIDNAEGTTVTCKHCHETQKLVEFFKFCEYCHKPLDGDDHVDSKSQVNMINT